MRNVYKTSSAEVSGNVVCVCVCVCEGDRYGRLFNLLLGRDEGSNWMRFS